MSLSVLEELHAVEERIVARLAELQPVVEEYEELQRVAERLGIEVPARGQRPAGQPAARVEEPSGGAAVPAARKPPARAKRAPRKRAAPKAASRGRAKKAAAKPGGTRAKGAERRDHIVALIRERPGITVPDISQELGLEPPPVYRVIRKLQAAGVVVKEGKNLRVT
jgi:hypothetical protein